MCFINRSVFSFLTTFVILFFFVYCFIVDNLSAENVSDDVCVGMIVVGVDKEDTSQLSDESIVFDLHKDDEKNIHDIIFGQDNNFIMCCLLWFLERFPIINQIFIKPFLYNMFSNC